MYIIEIYGQGGELFKGRGSSREEIR